MPTVINGIGTWYYGKRRIHRLKDTCEFCQHFGELQSYDTTLFFVIVFVPVIPLREYRILRQCPVCQRHRLLPLKEWEKSKSESIAELLEKLRQDPNSRENVLHGLALAIGYQDAVLLDQLAPALAVDRTDDAEIQTQLGHAYAYFSRWKDAENAYLASLKVRDDPAIRRELALMLLKQFRPDEAATLLEDIVEQQDADRAGYIYLLIEAYQAEGRHAEALEWIERRDAAFPQLASLKEYRSQRRTSERNRDTNRKVRAATLGESSQTGYSEGGWTAKLPRLILPLLVLVLLTAYLGAALWIGRSRTVYVVNGTPDAYTAVVGGREVMVPPNSHRPVQVVEGRVPVEVRGLRTPIAPLEVQVASPFWARPFWRYTFVLNPDQLAVVVQQKATYSEFPQQDNDPENYVVYIGEPLYTFTGIDLEFQPLPQTVKIEKGQTAVRRQVGLMEGITPEMRWLVVAQMINDPGRQMEYARRWLHVQPEDVLFLGWLQAGLPNEEMLTFLRSGLNERPLRIEWHRIYQNIMEKVHPEQALRPEYERLVAEQKDNPDALYLLARVLDLDEAEKVFRQAATANEPSGHAQHALGHRALSAGAFAEAVDWLEKATQRMPNYWPSRAEYQNALLAAQRYDQLLELVQPQPNASGPVFEHLLLRQRVLVQATRGNAVEAERLIDQAVRQQQAGAQMPNDTGRRLRLELELVMCAANNDAAGYLERAEKLEAPPRFEIAFLRDQLPEAVAATEGVLNDQAIVEHALLYLAAAQAGQPKLADEEWQRLLALLDEGDRFTRYMGDVLSGKQPVDPDRLRRWPLQVQHKRVLLVVAAHRFPEHRARLLALADPLCFTRDSMALCLRKVRQGVK